ncbi:YdbH domain-containing protein [Microbulbifer variabilis]|uniref:intermembrane phospholipid transport protein YdbH family protein n=1 Tax=Microbulbifer variabilis TaxID=266805 RepID=UPI001CFC64FE|nr:YdbH domain-containing protein [Microbulbifer variabilis]
MRKPRILVTTFIACVITLLVASWWKKDIVASQLINLFADEIVIQKLSGLKLSFREASIEQVRLQSSHDSNLVLNKVQILNPFHIVFDRDNIQEVELSIAELTYQKVKETTSIINNPSIIDPNEESALTLDNIIQGITRYMPGVVSVEKITLGQEFKAGPLRVTRSNTELFVELPYNSTETGQLNVTLIANLTSNSITAKAQVASDFSEEASQLKINISRVNLDQWEFHSTANSNLKSIDPILSFSEALAVFPSNGMSANGKISIDTKSIIPNNFLSIANYQDTLVKVESNGLELTFLSESLNSKIKARLSAQSPIELKLKTLNPVKFESATGSGFIELSTVKDAVTKSHLASLRFNSANLVADPKLQVTGSVDLFAAKPLLESQLVKKYFPSVTFTNLKGELNFQSEAFLNLTGTSFTEQDWLEKIHLTLLPNSKLQLDTEVTGLKEESPLLSTGLDHSQAQIEIMKEVLLIGESSKSDSFKLKATEGAIDAQLKAKNSPTSIHAKIEQIQCRMDDNVECIFDLKAKSPEFIDKQTDIRLSEINIDSRVHFLTSANTQTIKLEQVKASFDEIKTKDFHISQGEIQSPNANCKFSKNTTSCTSEKWSNQFNTFTSEYTTLSGNLDVSNFKLASSLGNTEFSGNFGSSRLEIESPENYALQASVIGSFSVNGNKLQGQSQLKAGTLQFNSSWQHDLERANGRIRFSLPKVNFDSKTPLSKSVRGLPVDIVSGSLTANGTLSWPSKPKDTIDMTLNKVAVVYDGSFATGIDGNILVENHGEHWLTPEPQPLTIQSINAGLPLSNVSFSLFLDRAKDLALKDFSAEFLEGMLSSNALYWNLDNKERSSILYAKDVSLEQLAEVTESESFKAKGRLNLTIPVTTGPGGITVKNGHLEAIEPGGELRYYGAFSPQMLASNPQLKLISNALEDYDFRTLEGNLQYPPSGDLQLNLKLVGRSESMDAERDLIINLNLENNIPTMLRSLQASRDLTTALEKQLDQ